MDLSVLMDALLKDGRENPMRVLAAPRPGAAVSGIAQSSRSVAPGNLFPAVPGTNADGHDFVADAVSRGASVVVVERPVSVPPEVCVVQVKSSRRALATLAARWFGEPARSLTVVAITGTNGKTTVSFLLEAVLAAAGFTVGVIGTVNCRYKGRTVDTGVTTPDPLVLQGMLADMKQAGVTHVVMEVSSHALVQDRVRRIGFDAAVFTNLTQDHLDFHGDMASYAAAKALLFTDYARDNGGKEMRAVINRDDPFGAELARRALCPVVTTGLTDEADVAGSELVLSPEGLSGRVRTPGGAFSLHSDMAGLHNFRNVLSAAGAAHCLGIAPEAVKRGIEGLDRVPGRLDRVKNDLGRNVFIDYAHSPDAVVNVLSALSGSGARRIITVLGCGGDRDRKKRPLMGAAAAERSDILVITSDNPRSENPDDIIAQILPGVTPHMERLDEGTLLSGAAEKGFFVEPAREKAILAAVLASRPGDTVLIAGKGHEDYQILGSQKRHFDDREEAASALCILARRPEGRADDTGERGKRSRRNG